MAQLTDDCFAFGGPMLSIDQAIAMIRERVTPVDGVEQLSLGDADGRVLARDLVSPINLPPFFNSAVDGYAVRHRDLSSDAETKLPVSGRIIAGDAAGALPPGVAARIFTGAPMPDGADTVFMQEDTREEDGFVTLPAGLKRGANARPAGEDVKLGAELLPAGRILQPQDISLAAAVGLSELAVRRRVRVAIFSTGNEVAATHSLPSGAIYDANRPLLISMLRRIGAQVSDLGVLRDAREPMAAALAQAAGDHDLILTTGGVSTGEEDHVKAAVEEVGALTFWRIGVKPGRPVALGVINGCAFAGLPGNPVAAFVTFVFIARPLVAQLAGAQLRKPLPLIARAGFSYKKKKGRREYVRVVATYGEGAYVARKFPQDGAGVITSLTETDGLAEIDDDVTSVSAGEELRVYPYAQLLSG